jgi:hypothetical protein
MSNKIISIILIFGIILSSVFLYYKCVNLVETFVNNSTSTDTSADTAADASQIQ